eukprot:COSAG02_NODE_4923_length_4834_cov_3.094192_5_plen_172_part_00
MGKQPTPTPQHPLRLVVRDLLALDRHKCIICCVVYRLVSPTPRDRSRWGLYQRWCFACCTLQGWHYARFASPKRWSSLKDFFYDYCTIHVQKAPVNSLESLRADGMLQRRVSPRREGHYPKPTPMLMPQPGPGANKQEREHKQLWCAVCGTYKTQTMLSKGAFLFFSFSFI